MAAQTGKVSSPGWVLGLVRQGSCEQAPAYYTSMRDSANRRETVEALHWDQGSSRSQAAKRGTH